VANRSGARGKLTVYGRQLLVHRIVEQGYPPARAAAMQGVSRSCAYRWLRRYRDEGWEGLADRSHRPRRSSRRCSAELERRILAERAATKLGPHRLSWRLGVSRSGGWAERRIPWYRTAGTEFPSCGLPRGGSELAT
jgi:transposase